MSGIWESRVLDVGCGNAVLDWIYVFLYTFRNEDFGGRVGLYAKFL